MRKSNKELTTMLTLTTSTQNVTLEDPSELDIIEKISLIANSPEGGHIEIERTIDGCTLVLFAQSGVFQLGIGNIDLETWDFLISDPSSIGFQQIFGNLVPKRQAIFDLNQVNKVVLRFLRVGDLDPTSTWEHRETEL
jgi:hypothetical protein